MVLDRGAELVHLSVSDVASPAGAAPSSVVRACRRLGFRGFQELKIAAVLHAPASPPEQPAADPDDPAAGALVDTLRAARAALEGLTATLGPDDLRAAAELLNDASRYFWSALGCPAPWRWTSPTGCARSACRWTPRPISRSPPAG
ncbi:MurR/RpiR family transcriptional regulator [Kitasatospora sp. NPDC059599]|uniref:MurR/RpiR family transcriptional regulator n=1 Tax=Kitasatospora sp. NPDC059599 TaxID=3346880 RepID=UPI00367D8C00